MMIHAIVVGLTMLLSASAFVPPPATGVVFGDVEVSTMLTANKIVPATFFTNCVRSPMTVVLNSQSTIDWMMTKGAASPTCADSVDIWKMTQQQRQAWNGTALTVKNLFLNSFNTYRSYAMTRPTAQCVVSGLGSSDIAPYMNVVASADPTNPDRFLITLSKLPGGGTNQGGSGVTD